VTSTLALTSATLPYLAALADGGVDAVRDVPILRSGASTHRGVLLNEAVAAAHDLPWTPAEDALRA
jgi:alanine dehydrogenase